MAISPKVDRTRSAAGTRGRLLAKRIAFAVDDFVPSETGAVVLAYHRVGARSPSPVDLPTAHFRRQMEHVRRDAASLDEALGFLETADACDSAPLVVTFDDGTKDFAEVVLPILVELDIPVLLYLATSNVDSGHSYPHEGQPISWNELRDCVSTGLVEIGAHTHDHILLDRCSSAVALAQFDRCDERIEDELGVSPRHFAYPKAVAPQAEVDRLVRARYDSAAVAGTRPNTSATDRYRLHRSPIQNADGWDGFVRKAGGGMRVEDDLRRVINLVRYRAKTS